VDAHQSGAKDYSASLWTVMMFEAFLRHNGASVPASPAAAELIT
jgi:asparagine synthase (glutamine-hydrolysing)